MSGTSLDGIDGVVLGFGHGVDGAESVRCLGHWRARFPTRLRARLLECASGRSTSWETAQLHHDLGRFYARACVRGLAGSPVDAVGLHGQTVFHRPPPGDAATMQLGEPAYLAAALGVPVVANFRAADLALGGQGAPLATLFHVRAFGLRGEHVCVQNLGGIGNVTSVDWRRGSRPRVVAFDTGPGNLLIDGAMRRITGDPRGFDRGGRMAARGRPALDLVRGWLREPYFRRRPPKSTGREAFGDDDLAARWQAMEAAALSDADRVSTLTEFSAASVVDAYERHLEGRPRRVILCGGGARNGHLAARLCERFEVVMPGTDVIIADACGWPVEVVEGAAFAWLARERLLGRAGNLPETTGAHRAARCGQVVEV